MNRYIPGPCKICKVEPKVLTDFPEIKKLPWELVINYAIPGTVGETTITSNFRWKRSHQSKNNA